MKNQTNFKVKLSDAFPSVTKKKTALHKTWKLKRNQENNLHNNTI